MCGGESSRGPSRTPTGVSRREGRNDGVCSHFRSGRYWTRTSDPLLVRSDGGLNKRSGFAGLFVPLGGLPEVLALPVFAGVCRGLWPRMGDRGLLAFAVV